MLDHFEEIFQDYSRIIRKLRITVEISLILISIDVYMNA